MDNEAKIKVTVAVMGWSVGFIQGSDILEVVPMATKTGSLRKAFWADMARHAENYEFENVDLDLQLISI